MNFELQNEELKEIDKEIFKTNKYYSMAVTSLNKLPNLYAGKEFLKIVKNIKAKLKKIKTNDSFEKLFIENSLLNIETQRIYLEYFTTGKHENLDQLISKIFGKNTIKIVKENCKNFNYKNFWDFYLSYQEYTYKQIPSDDEYLRDTFKKLLVQIKKDLLKYGAKNFNLQKNYNFDLILGQPYSQRSFFTPTTKRMEISPSTFFVFKEDEKTKINVTAVIETLFHELLGHGRHELNSRNMPSSLQDNSIITYIATSHIHSEGVAQLTEKASIEFMRANKKKYKIEEDYVKQRILSESTLLAGNLEIYYKYLSLKKLENPRLNLEKEFKKVVDNHGLYVLYSASQNNSPISMMHQLSYPLGLKCMGEIFSNLEKKMGKEKFEENLPIINQAISTGVWNFKVLPKFVDLFLKREGILN